MCIQLRTNYHQPVANTELTGVPGDVVKVIGIVKCVEVPTEGGGAFGRGSAKPKCMYLLYLEAISVHNEKASSALAPPRPSPA